MKREEVNKRYLNRNKLLCRIIGIWPFQSRMRRILAQTLVYSISLTGIGTQILRVIVFFSPDILMEQCPFIVAASGIALKVANYGLNYDREIICVTNSLLQVRTYVANSLRLTQFVNDIYNDWEVERPPAEIEIMDVYGKRGVLITLVYIATSTFGTFVFVMMPTTATVVMYFLRKENGTVIRYYMYPSYYPLDEDKYFIYFWMHMVMVILGVAVVFCTCDTLYMFGVQHGCGLLAVSGYRFKSAIENYASHETESAEAMDVAYKKVCSSIQGHKRALRFIQDIQDLHSTYLAIGIILLITAFSITLVKASLMDVCLEFYKYVGFLVVQLVHLFFMTIQGQFVQNAYDKIYNEMYAGLWYNSSRRTKMLYLLALRESLTSPALSAGGFLPLTLETFAEVLKASVSYFTVLKSQ